jgi:hypothetical protein
MSWKKLLAEGKVHAHKTSKKELDDLPAVIVRDLKDAAIQELSDDRRFATAYNAALQTAKMAIACAGYRLAGTQGHHRLTFEAARLALVSAMRPSTLRLRCFPGLRFLTRNLRQKAEECKGTTPFRFLFCKIFSLWRKQFL